MSAAWHPNGLIRIYAETSESVYHGLVVRWSDGGKVVSAVEYEAGLALPPQPG
ncbi:MAG: hypothetical protein ACRC8S_11740 [Fimbriiglobus sp.]